MKVIKSKAEDFVFPFIFCQRKNLKQQVPAFSVYKMNVLDFMI